LHCITASLETYIFKSLGNRPVASVKPGEIMAAVKRIEEAGAGDQSGRVLQRVKSIYRSAVNHERHRAAPKALPPQPKGRRCSGEASTQTRFTGTRSVSLASASGVASAKSSRGTSGVAGAWPATSCRSRSSPAVSCPRRRLCLIASRTPAFFAFHPPVCQLPREICWLSLVC